MTLLSFLDLSVHDELCFWTVIGVVNTVLDAFYFPMHAELKLAWHINMPEELSNPIQNVYRLMISALILIQCFTVHAYLATYVIMLYPVFLEEKPMLLFPWLLLSAINRLLCHLIGLTLGLTLCLLLGAAKPACLVFLVKKLFTIAPPMYMWILVHRYYKYLKMSKKYNKVKLTTSDTDIDYGLEQAVRRRCAKSLYNEKILRKSVTERMILDIPTVSKLSCNASKTSVGPPVATSNEKVMVIHLSVKSNSIVSALSKESSVELPNIEKWCNLEVHTKRDTDRVIDQIGSMLLRIAAYKNEDSYTETAHLTCESIEETKSVNVMTTQSCLTSNSIKSNKIIRHTEDTKPTTTYGGAYLYQYPGIFLKRSKSKDVLSDAKTRRHFENILTGRSRKNEITQTSTELLSPNSNIEELNDSQPESISERDKDSS